MRSTVILAMFISTLAVPARAANQESMDELRVLVDTMIQVDTFDNLRKRAVALFKSLDIDGEPGLSRGDFVARVTAFEIMNTLAFDQDGDYRVSTNEVCRALSEFHQSADDIAIRHTGPCPLGQPGWESLSPAVERQLKADKNRDGVITPREMYEYAAKVAPLSLHRDPLLQSIPLGLATGKGTLALTDFEAAIDQIIAEIDTDQNGLVTIEKKLAYRRKMQAIWISVSERRRRVRQQAELSLAAALEGVPAPPDDALISVAGINHGAALSSVSVGEYRSETTVAQVEIEEGDKRLYLVLASFEPTIWLLSGATDRVAQVVALNARGDGPLSGVVGIEKYRVVAARLRLYSLLQQSEADQQRAILKALLGRDPDAVITSNQLSRAVVPSGTANDDFTFPHLIPPPTKKAARAVYSQAKHFYPAGIADIDPASVVSTAPARRYDTLPGKMGLAYLVEKGVLEYNSFGNNSQDRAGDFDDMQSSELSIAFMLGRFRVVGPMTFPTGLYGAEAVGFVVAKGVRMPEGDPGHSPVICEVTRKEMKIGDVCQ